MEEKLIENWLITFEGYGYGYGYGNGYGNGNGNGNGCGYGYGSGSGYGYGNGCGYGNGDGCGNGNGNGCGYGYGYGSGYKYFNKQRVFYVDTIPTLINHIHRNIAKGFIISDLTLKETYIAKGHNLFAHGKTIKEAINSLQEKIYANLNPEEAIQEFKRHFNNADSYSGEEFFAWHSIVTGSCFQGREEFVKTKGLDVHAKYTVKQFLEICKGAYGWNVLKELTKYYK